MTTGEMLGYLRRLTEIRQLENTDLKDRRLANMMTDLEEKYGIPVLRDETFEKENPVVMQLYRAVAEERNI